MKGTIKVAVHEPVCDFDYCRNPIILAAVHAGYRQLKD